jgi:hypothetical protein
MPSSSSSCCWRLSSHLNEGCPQLNEHNDHEMTHGLVATTVLVSLLWTCRIQEVALGSSPFLDYGKRSQPTAVKSDLTFRKEPFPSLSKLGASYRSPSESRAPIVVVTHSASITFVTGGRQVLTEQVELADVLRHCAPCWAGFNFFSASMGVHKCTLLRNSSLVALCNRW